MELLLDLDGTILDTRPIEADREARKWKECVRRKHETALFDGITETCAEVRRRGVRMAIVTSSVSFYAENMLSFHCVPYDVLVAYHDTRSHKPQPEPMLAAARCLCVDPDTVLSVGDSEVDLKASKAAGMRAGAARWNTECHDGETWDIVFDRPSDILEYMDNHA